MAFEFLRTATVIDYPYLWLRESRKGETEGRKFRPVVVGIRFSSADLGDTIVLFPITTKLPQSDIFSAEIPPYEKKRAGLDVDRSLWIILEEYNVDRVQHSFYLKPQQPRGTFSKGFFLPLMEEFVRRRKTLQGSDRTI